MDTDTDEETTDDEVPTRARRKRQPPKTKYYPNIADKGNHPIESITRRFYEDLSLKVSFPELISACPEFRKKIAADIRQHKIPIEEYDERIRRRDEKEKQKENQHVTFNLRGFTGYHTPLDFLRKYHNIRSEELRDENEIIFYTKSEKNDYREPILSGMSPHVNVKINDMKDSVRALLDSGAEVNLMTMPLFKKLDIPIETAMPHRTQLRNMDGQISYVTGLVHNVEITIGSVSVRISAFVSSGRLSHDLVLGRPFRRLARLDERNCDDGSVWCRIFDPDSAKSAQFMAAPGNIGIQTLASFLENSKRWVTPEYTTPMLRRYKGRAMQIEYHDETPQDKEDSTKGSCIVELDDDDEVNEYTVASYLYDHDDIGDNEVYSYLDEEEVYTMDDNLMFEDDYEEYEIRAKYKPVAKKIKPVAVPLEGGLKPEAHLQREDETIVPVMDQERKNRFDGREHLIIFGEDLTDAERAAFL